MNDPEQIAAGKQLFSAMNCVGCHFNGGGGMGPPLMDNIWIYGNSIENIAATIREGRPNGMPSFRAFCPTSKSGSSQLTPVRSRIRRRTTRLHKTRRSDNRAAWRFTNKWLARREP